MRSFNRQLSGSALLVLICSYCHVCHSQVMAVETFSYPAGTPLHLEGGGSGWSDVWHTQNNDVTVPGYSVDNASFTYPGFAFTGNYLIGGIAYQTVGRWLDYSTGGAFAPYIKSNVIGQGNLWIACLVRKDISNEDEVSLHLANSNVDWAYDMEKIAFGYFGSNSDFAGGRYWTLQIAGATLLQQSLVPVTIGTAALIVLHVRFDDPSPGTTTVDMFVNPALNTQPTTPDVTLSATSDMGFRNMAINGSPPQNGSAWDEIRFAATYPDAVNSGSPLPVNFISFTTAYDPVQQQVDLDWATAQEANSAYFVVGRSTNGNAFDSIGVIRAAGSSSDPRHYHFADTGAEALTGQLFYRIKEIDRDGRATYSTIRTIRVGGGTPMLFGPNPVKDRLNVQWPYGDASRITITVADGQGNTVLRKEFNYSAVIQLPVSFLSPGVYYVSGQDDKQRVVGVFIIAKNP